MKKSMSKRQKDIRAKLMAAVSMLLVASIMMVSSTYAWFTLSTAPEVTGIQTAVGANGNLEMALLPKDGQTSSITSQVGDSSKDIKQKNVTWGNLVDLSDETVYGLDKIALYPSELNAAISDAAGNPLTLADTLLKTPTYGADGRIHELSPNTVTSTYDRSKGNFPSNTDYGVRAVGTASGMTDRQLAYRNARSTANTAMAQAQNAAVNSLSTNGNALADIAIKHGTDSDATHTQAEVASLLAIVNDLLGTDDKTGILQYIEQSYLQYILAYGASQESVNLGMDDTEFNAFKNSVESAATPAEALTLLEGTYNILMDAAITAPIEKLAATKANVEQAKTNLTELTDDGDKIPWGSISPALNLLADTEGMTINDIPAKDITKEESINKLVNTISGGLTISMASGGGVYADVADHCGDYSANIIIKELTYGSITVTNMKAGMATKSAVNPPYLSTFGTSVQVAGAPKSAEETTMPLTEMYGYIIDLAFKTNAAESNLLLQQKGTDRIYSDNSNEETMGHGSTMTFKATATGFSDEQVKRLMSAIRIVFFQKDNGNVVATAKLDATNATLGADGLTAEMYLYTVTAGGEERYVPATYDATKTDVVYYTMNEDYVYTEATDVTADNIADKITAGLYTENGENYTKVTVGTEFDEGTKYFTRSAEAQEVYTQITQAPAEGTTVYIKEIAAAGENKKTDNVITALAQNAEMQISVLVYLDGNYVTNEQVAATAGTSVTGTMNLQFSSSATLVPMEYAALHTSGSNENAEGGAAVNDGSDAEGNS